METSVLARPLPPLSDARIDRLLVTQQTRPDRLYRPIGFLSCDDREYTFEYLRQAVGADWFVGLPGLRAHQSPFRSEQLFPIFAERVISPRRPDRPQAMHALGLPIDAAPFEVLSRTGGRRVGDTIELVSVPRAQADGAVSQLFLVHGIRHRTEEAQSRVSQLRPGDELRMVPDHGNRVNPMAVRIEDTDELHLGFVPDPLAGFFRDIANDDREHQLRVELANGPEVGFHLRLLVRLNGFITSGHQPFVGSGWETVH